MGADGVVYSKDARKKEGFLFISDMISSAYSAVLVNTPSPTMGLLGWEWEYKKENKMINNDRRCLALYFTILKIINNL